MHDLRGTIYTTKQIERVLRALPYLPEPGSAASDIRAIKLSYGTRGTWLEDRMAERADVEWALSQLPNDDKASTYRCVYLYYVGGGPTERFTMYDVAELVDVSYRTVQRRLSDGLREMSRLLREGRAGRSRMEHDD